MAKKVIVTKSKLNAIGDAIRIRTGENGRYTLDEMPDAIRSISGSGGDGGELIINDLYDTSKFEVINISTGDFNSAPAGTMAPLFNVADLSSDSRISDSDVLYLKWRLINRSDPSIDTDNSVITASTALGGGGDSYSMDSRHFMQSFHACTNGYSYSYCDSPFLRITKNTRILMSFYKHHSSSFLSFEIRVFKKL